MKTMQGWHDSKQELTPYCRDAFDVAVWLSYLDNASAPGRGGGHDIQSAICESLEAGDEVDLLSQR